MIDFTEVEEYFPETDNILIIKPYTFNIRVSHDEEEETYILNLKITQADNKKEHHIKFRFGIGKHKLQPKSVHETDKPHFEIEVSKRTRESFSATIYFTFTKKGDQDILNYLKGTIYLINKIMGDFFIKNKLDIKRTSEIIYSEEVEKDLGKYEEILLDSLKDCYDNKELIVRDGKTPVVIKTLRNLQKYLEIEELKSLYLPLKEKIENKKLSL